MRLNRKKNNNKEITLNKNIRVYMKFTIVLSLFFSLISLLVVIGRSKTLFLLKFVDSDAADNFRFFGYLVLYFPFVPIVLKDGFVFIILLINNYIVTKKYQNQKNFFKIQNQNVLPNLGSVKYVLMDKTGTITKNQI